MVDVHPAHFAGDPAFQIAFKGRGDTGIPTGAIAQNFTRAEIGTGASLILVSGRLTVTILPLVRGQVVSALTFVRANQALGTPTNWWFALYTKTLGLLGQTPDQTTAAWASNSPQTLSFTSGISIPTTDYYYAGIMCAATTPGPLVSFSQALGLSTIDPYLAGTSTTGLTTTAPDPAAALTPANAAWCYAS